jgi:uncharacterized small protein (DUF1192 family)
MTREQIEIEAKRRAKLRHCSLCPKQRFTVCRDHGYECDDARMVYDAFLAGAEFRQAEIDTLNEEIQGLKATLDLEVNLHQPKLEKQITALTVDIERYKADVIEGLERERVARKVIEDKRGEVEELKEALQALYDMCAEGKTDEGALYSAQQILKKHSK